MEKEIEETFELIDKKSNIENDNEFISLKMSEEQYDYLLLVLTGLVDMEKKVPKYAKTSRSKILLELYNKVKEIVVD